MIANVVAYVHILDLSIFRQLYEKVFVDVVKVLLDFLLAELTVLVVRRVVIDIGNKDCLRKVGLDMLPGATVTVSAGAYLEVEGAVDPGSRWKRDSNRALLELRSYAERARNIRREKEEE